MRILIVNWTWYPSGGDWTYVDNLVKFYESKGHEVIPFSMKNERNFESEYKEYFISEIDYKELNRNKSIINGFKAIQKTIYSVEAKQKIKAILARYKVDLVHINNIHHYLTPSSIIPEIKKKGIPVIWTLHDYVMLCPNTTFISNGQLCEKCKGGKYFNSVINKCKKGSRSASLVAALENYANDFLNPYRHVDYFICPSRFIASKFIEYGYPPEKVVQVYNLYNIDKLEVNAVNIGSNEAYLLYIGRVTKEKGIMTLLNAVKGINTKVLIVGDGEDLPFFEIVKKEESIDNVYFLGNKNKEDVLNYIRNATLVLVPSEWYENLPYSLVEAMLLCKPVLGAKIGGIPELLVEGKTGFLFEPGREQDLNEKIRSILAMNPLELKGIGENAGRMVRETVSFTSFENQMRPLFLSLKLEL